MLLGFGEIMMRIATEGYLRFRQAMPGKVETTFAGGEVNVCASLAILGTKSRFLTALPRNAITDGLIATLQGLGIDTRHIVYRDGRLGIYFLETGANQRSSTIIYDRDYSAIALAAPREYDFVHALEGVTHVYITGITPALSENAFQSTLALVQTAKDRHLHVSCDLNFRKKLWRWKPGYRPEQLAGECMSKILPFVDLIIGNEEDAADVLNIHADGTVVEKGQINASAYEKVSRAICKQFPSVSQAAITLRESLSATHNNWGGMLFDRQTDKAFFAPLNEQGEYTPYEIRNIVDRVGGGDSFAAGLLYALTSETFSAPDMTIRFAAATSCLKHSIRGDFNYVTRDEVVSLMQGNASGRVRR